ncbi:MAG: DUF839 domain-containing protein [Bacteroidia bacterium]|nr:DUF839 domain-containing protein [Bacteroidia bacterium]
MNFFSPVKTILFCVLFPVLAQGQGFGNFLGLMPHSQNLYFEIPNGFSFQVLVKASDTLSSGEIMPINSDFTGFLPKNGINPLNGYLLINSETKPGGATLFDANFDNIMRRWVISNGQKLDFSAFSCGIGAGTLNNCSGGITPWGTFVSCEEKAFDTLNCNYKGYPTFGWCIEINPLTRQVVDYENDGNPDKIWSFGRMQHENACFAPDYRTAYFGEDNFNPGYLFKFIADTASNLSSGTLFTLKLNADSTTGTWLPIQNNTITERCSVIQQATTLGATPFMRIEDVEIGPGGKIYFASTLHGKIFRFQDLGNNIAQFETFASSQNYLVQYEGGQVQESFSWPDNLCFDPEGNLYVTQDGGNNHIWRFGANHSQALPQVSIFANTPVGSEPTGINFSPDGNFLFLSIQHPSPLNSAQQYDVLGNPVNFIKDVSLVIARNETFTGGTQSVHPTPDFPITFSFIAEEHKLLCYPNSNLPLTGEWQIINELGQSLLKQSFNAGENHHILAWDLNILESGFYLLDIQVNNQHKFFRFVFN